MIVICIGTYGHANLEGKIKVEAIESIPYYYLIRTTFLGPNRPVLILSERNGYSRGRNISVGKVYSFSLEMMSTIRNGERKEEQIILPPKTFSIDNKLICVDGRLPYRAAFRRPMCIMIISRRWTRNTQAHVSQQPCPRRVCL
jgi:hypothetical protein